MYTNLVFELSMVLNNEEFHKILAKACSRSDCLEETEEGYIDHSLASKGIMVIYRDSHYKKKVKLVVNAKLMLNSDALDLDKLIRKLSKRISGYFDNRYRIEDFDLSGMNITADIDVGSHQQVSAYLKVLQRIGRVKGFSPSAYEGIDENSSFCLDGNSNGIEFLMYDLQRAVMDRLSRTEISQKKLKSKGEEVEGILRTEVRLVKPKAIRAYADATDVSKQIISLSEKCRDIFFDTFTRIVPFGDFYKKDKAVEIVRSEVKDSTLRRRMLQLLTLIPEKKSLYLAQKAMNCRDVEKVMDAFAKINVSPVTVSKRHDVKHLKCVYDYLLGKRYKNNSI